MGSKALVPAVRTSPARLMQMLVVATIFSSSVGAQGLYEWETYEKRMESAKSVAALGSDVFGDNINLQDGALSFSVTDVDVPGNSSLPVSFTRTYSVQNSRDVVSDQLLADWSVQIPRIYGQFVTEWVGGVNSVDRCSNFQLPAIPHPDGTPPGTFQYRQFWRGINVDIPGVASGEMLQTSTGAPRPSDGRSYRWTTTDGLVHFYCEPSSRPSVIGEVFVAVGPDGTKYYFDWPARRDVPDVLVPNGEHGNHRLPVVENSLYVTKVVDRFGNEVNYTYSNASTAPVRLSQIRANDGRQIDVGYGANGFISSVTSGNRAWQYHYGVDASPTGQPTLTRVTLPDTRSWQIQFASLTYAPIRNETDPERDCLMPAQPENHADVAVGTVIHPSGVAATFRLALDYHGQSNVTMACENVDIVGSQNDPNDDLNLHAPNYYSWTLQSKVISGPGVSPQSWEYSYLPKNISGIVRGSPDPDTMPVCFNYLLPEGSPRCDQPTCTSGWCGASLTTVTAPDGTRQRYHIGNSWQYNTGKMLKIERLPVCQDPPGCQSTASNTALEVETSDYELATSGRPYATFFGTSTRSNGDGFESVYPRPVIEKTRLRDGASFSWLVDAHPIGGYRLDPLLRPTHVTRRSVGTLPQANQKAETYTYHDNYLKWVVGQLASTHVRINGVDVETARAEYDPTTALMLRVFVHGLRKQTLTYNPDGTLFSVRDGRLLRTIFEDWKRGVPQWILHSDGSQQWAVVNDHGWITSTINEESQTTSYGYDAMGRITSITPPANPDGAPWAATSISFAPIDSPIFGLAGPTPQGTPGHWRQRVTRGGYQQDTYYDTLWRPVLVHESGSGRNRYSVKGWDSMNRESFSAYPLDSLGSVSQATAGVRRTFDALSRPLNETADSELGPLTTQIQYLSGFRKLVTNPRSKSTTFSFMAFDEPSDELPVRIDAPHGQTTVISRDVHGKPMSVSRTASINGVQTTVDRRYVYDSAQRLCKRIEPETGAHLFGYDAADNLEWSVHGSASTANSCDAQPDVRIVRSYDLRNRLTRIDYPGATADIDYTYHADGTLWTASRSGSTWTYLYNSLDLLKSESLAFENQTRSFSYQYDSLGHQTSITYPDQETLGFDPNALGQPTRVGSYATNLSWHPGGALSQATFGNGLLHTRQLNTRQLPMRLRYARGTQSLVELAYNFDANGNVGTIDDVAQGGLDSTSFLYDDLDRLTQATQPQGYSSAIYEYDAFDNLRRYVLGGRDFRYHYTDGTNRLNSIVPTNGSTLLFAYDDRGNTTASGPTGAQALVSFDLADTVTSVQGAVHESYTYDAHGHRIKIVSGASTRYPLYSRDGLLRMEFGPGQADSYYYLGTQLLAKSGSGAAPVDLIFASSGEAPGAPLQGDKRAPRLPTLPGQKSGSTITWYLSDHLGSNVATANAAGDVLERSRFTPYGERWGKVSERGPGYTGHFEDGTGLNYMKARYQSGIVGRFISPDPVLTDANGGNFNRYWYANNNPMRFVDPDGRIVETAWDAISIVYDVGKIGVGYITNNPVMVSEGAIDLGVDTVSLLVPGMPAGGSKIARMGAKQADEVLSARKLPFNDADRVTEVNKTLDRIESGGPFPHAKDGTVFKNKEGKLPKGDYKEYTVDTPGASNRGARRVVQETNSGKTYYTDDHYKSFIEIDPK